MQINHQPLTRGHKTLGAKWLFDFWFSHQSSLYLASEVTPKPPTFHTASRYHPLKKKKKRNEKTTDFITIRNDIKCLQH